MNSAKDDSLCTILVTGGAGYLGSILVPLLLGQGHKVRVLDRLYFGDESLTSVADCDRLEVITEDIHNHDNLPRLFEGVDSVVHLASISNDPSCDLDPNLTITTNFLASVNFARRAKMEGVERFIFISSCSVYGASSSIVATESAPTAPVTLYALTKLENEHELAKLSSDTFQITVLRLATLFGFSPRMRFDLAINSMTSRAVQGKSIIVYGQGSQYRPFVHVQDAAAGIIATLESEKRRDGRMEIFNLGNDDLNYTIYDLAQEIRSALPGSGIELVDKNDDIRSYRVDSAKIADCLGVVANISIAEGVKEIAAAYLQEQFTDMDDDRYYNVRVMNRELNGAALPLSAASAPRWAIATDL